MSTRNRPTCVNVVASAMTKGTFTNRANVFASNVFPVFTKCKLEMQFDHADINKSCLGRQWFSVDVTEEHCSVIIKPEPVGPIKSTLLFSSSTLSSSSSSILSGIPDSAPDLVLKSNVSILLDQPKTTRKVYKNILPVLKKVFPFKKENKNQNEFQIICISQK